MRAEVFKEGGERGWEEGDEGERTPTSRVTPEPTSGDRGNC